MSWVMPEVARCVDAALSEVGFPGCVRPPAEYHPSGTAFGVPRGVVPVDVTHRAMLLYRVRQDPNRLVPCAAHATVTHRGECPMYPAIALLVGATRGCEVLS